MQNVEQPAQVCILSTSYIILNKCIPICSPSYCSLCFYMYQTDKHGDGERGQDDATALPEDCGDGPEDGSNGLENHDSGLDDSGMASKDSNNESRRCEPPGKRAVQLLAICANFPICKIHGYDWNDVRCIYVQRRGEVQEVYTTPSDTAT